jgi:hypothetical protein
VKKRCPIAAGPVSGQEITAKSTDNFRAALCNRRARPQVLAGAIPKKIRGKPTQNYRSSSVLEAASAGVSDPKEWF